MNDLLLSVIIPCRNEEKYIRSILDFYLRASPENKELIVADGESTDRTAEIVRQYASLHSHIHLIGNYRKFVPFALNDCIRKARGKYVVRLDAHTEYADDYFEKIIGTFEKTGADIVGGPMRAKGKAPFQRAVAVCTSTVFGVGDSRFHDETAEGYTDSVYLGAWKREMFSVTGLFDEDMLRNQDDEFHYRARSMGMKIYLNPAIKSWYYPRSSIRSLMKQYFQYGLFKPLVLSKVKSEVKARHLVPSAFVLYLVSILLFYPLAGFLSVVPLLMYATIDLFFSFARQNGFVEKIISLAVYPVLHLSYGCGFILGLNKSLRKYFFKG